jgi:hypothetical protein
VLLRAFVGLRVRLLLRGETGQGTLEYVGMVAVAALLAVAVLQAVQNADLQEFFTAQIRKVTGGGGPGGGAGSPGGG